MFLVLQKVYLCRMRSLYFLWVNQKKFYLIVGSLVLNLDTYIWFKRILSLIPNLSDFKTTQKTCFKIWHKIKCMFKNKHTELDFCLLLSVTMSRK